MLLTSFASRNFYQNQQRLAASAVEIGIKKIYLWKYINLLKYLKFWQHLKIFRSKRGAGYWAWHGIVIKKALDKVGENELVIFCDAGLKFINKVDFLEVIMQNRHVALFSSGGFTNRQYTKRDTFIIMECDEKKYWDGIQVMGGFHVWKKCEASYKLLDEYENYCLNYQAVSDSPNVYEKNLPEFVDHRHPQSIMSILAVKYGYEVLPFPISYSKDDTNGGGGLPYKFLAPNRESHFSRLNIILRKTGLWF